MKSEPAGPAIVFGPSQNENRDQPAGEGGALTDLPDPMGSNMDEQIAGDEGEHDGDADMMQTWVWSMKRTSPKRNQP